MEVPSQPGMLNMPRHNDCSNHAMTQRKEVSIHSLHTLVSTAYVCVEWNSFVVVEPDVTWELACDLLWDDVAWYVAPPAVVPLVDVLEVCSYVPSRRVGLAAQSMHKPQLQGPVHVEDRRHCSDRAQDHAGKHA